MTKIVLVAVGISLSGAASLVGLTSAADAYNKSNAAIERVRKIQQDQDKQLAEAFSVLDRAR